MLTNCHSVLSLCQVIDLMLAHPQLGKMLAHPSISYGAKQLYARGIYEDDTRPNLCRPVRELLEGDEPAALLTVNDKKLSAPLRVRLRLKEQQQ
jgi:ubiquitin-activating enzyme E1 C